MLISQNTNLYFLNPTGSTPSIKIDPKLGLLEINGVSAPDDPLSFYGHLYALLVKFEDEGVRVINVKIALKKIVDSKSYVFILVKKLISFSKLGIEVNISWYYEKNASEMLSTGKEISNQYNYPFQFREVFKINYELLKAG
ncbi:MAG: SiaC family regulatory phosphoprotein [Reichenbachiella sp.]|uniref:SiaC family regulatory phosphoprotein n=1 Tax=Reichenbachiella sp. TaxID=2184521 RepID=UPI003262D533